MEFQVPSLLGGRRLGRFTLIGDWTSVSFCLNSWVVVMIKLMSVRHLSSMWTHRRCSIHADFIPFFFQLSQKHTQQPLIQKRVKSEWWLWGCSHETN